jgi:two-component system, OmpR family, response regulator
MRLLLVEDDPTLLESLERGLKQMGFGVETSRDGLEADAILSTRVFDLAVLDLGLPGLDGLEVLRRLRTRGAQMPVLVLTARDGVGNKVDGLNAGADDYLLKPFDFQELEARLRALLRRSQKDRAERLCVGQLNLDRAGRRAYVGMRPLELSAREIRVLETLMIRAGRVVSKEQLVSALSQDGEEIGENAVEVYIHRLRKKLEPAAVQIRTLRGLGYLMDRSLA